MGEDGIDEVLADTRSEAVREHTDWLWNSLAGAGR